jgi:predicted lipid-binding transport protein (Tim44 family)
MDDMIGVRFAEGDIDDLKKLVNAKVFMNLSDAVRDLTRRGMRDEIAKLEANT